MLIFYGIIAFCFGVGLAAGAMYFGRKVDQADYVVRGGTHRPENKKIFDEWYNKGWDAALQTLSPKKLTDETEVIVMGENGPQLRPAGVPAFVNTVSGYPDMPEEWIPKGVKNMKFGMPPVIKEEDLVYPPADVMAQLKEQVMNGDRGINSVRQEVGMPSLDEVVDNPPIQVRSYGPVMNPVFPGTEIIQDGTPHPPFEMPNSRGPQGLTLSELDNRILGLQGRDPEETVVVEEQLMFTDPPHHVLEKDLSHPLGSQPCCEGLGDAYR